MDHSILVPYDGSRRSQSALRYAADVFAGEKVIALHTLSPFATGPDSEDQASERYEQAQDVLKSVQDVETDRSVTVSSEFVYGHAIHVIRRYADLYTFDRIVIDGSYGVDSADQSLGTIPEAIVRQTQVPVTVLRSEFDNQIASPDTLLVAFDGSSPSCAALRHAIDTFPDTTVDVLYVRYPFIDDLDHLGVRSRDYPDFEQWYKAVRTWHERADRDADRILEIAGLIADESGADLRSLTDSGPPSRVILEYADRMEADHVLMGRHGHNGGMHTLLGSVTEQIVRRSSIPITVVK